MDVARPASRAPLARQARRPPLRAAFAAQPGVVACSADYSITRLARTIIDAGITPGCRDLDDLETQPRRGIPQVWQRIALLASEMARHHHAPGTWQQFAQQFQALGADLELREMYAGGVPARAGEILDQPGADRIGNPVKTVGVV